MNQNQVIIRTYKGSQAGATAAYQADAARLAAQGYFPTSQSWAPGAYGCGSFLLALLLCIILIGILVFIYMLIVKPDGTLSVTYEWRGVLARAENTLPSAEKTCPKCAEQVKAAALVCRFCGYEFTTTSH
jgi:hypothetical protein